MYNSIASAVTGNVNTQMQFYNTFQISNFKDKRHARLKLGKLKQQSKNNPHLSTVFSYGKYEKVG